MRRFDPEAIAALAEGRLSPEEAAELERAIADDAAASAELEAQRTALSFLGDGDSPELTMAERSELHSAVADAIGMTTPELAATGATRRIPWGSLGIATAALVGLVAVVPVVGLLSTGGSDGASLELAAEAPTTTAELDTAAARTADTDEEAGVGAFDENDGLTAGDAAEDLAAFGSSTTLPPTTTQAAPAAAGSSPTTAAATASSTTVADSTSTTEAAPPAPEGLEELSQDLETLRSDSATVSAMASEASEGATCWVEDTNVRATPPPERFAFEYQNGELTVIVYYAMSDGEIGPFQVWGLPDCAELVVIGNGE